LVWTIKNKIQLELLKRGIASPIIKCEEVIKNNVHRIEIKTASFQTIPVIFKELWIENFNSSIKEETIDVEGSEGILETIVYRVWIKIMYEYEHFGGGSNGCELFNLTCNCYKNESYSINPIIS